jgi:hypothetical protein
MKLPPTQIYKYSASSCILSQLPLPVCQQKMFTAKEQQDFPNKSQVPRQKNNKINLPI